jgi:uncharacterized membrane protein YdjX (TVP38/TMEM64 family)
MDPEHRLRRTADWLRGAAFMASLIVLAWIFHANDLGQILHREWIQDHVLGHGLEGYALMLGLTASFTAIGLPRHLPSLLAGWAFGVAVGFPIALAGTLIGAIVAYYYARLLGRGVLPRRLRPKIARMERSLARGPFTTALVARLLPVGSNLLTNLVAGLLRLPPRPFLAGSALGFAPQTLIFALMGKGLRVDPLWRIGLAVLLFAASTWLSRYVYLLQRREGEAADSSESELDSWTPSSTTGSRG